MMRFLSLYIVLVITAFAVLMVLAETTIARGFCTALVACAIKTAMVHVHDRVWTRFHK